jgi:tRNA(Met) cytidine acetyltransferase
MNELHEVIQANLNSTHHSLLVSQMASLQELVEKTIDCSSFEFCLPSKVNQYLGQELDCLIYDCQHFNPNNFAAITGSLCGGGTLYLLLVDDGKQQEQVLAKTRNDANNKISCATESATFSRLLNLLTNNKNFSRGKFEPQDPVITDSDTFLEQQRRVIEAIKRCANGHSNRPVVITANRGRGKSAALGIASAELLIESNKRVLVTAPSKANVRVLIDHFDKVRSRSREVGKFETAKEKELFIALDKLISSKPKTDLLIVEEAGSIPVQQLSVITKHYNRIIFSTTVDGYEGNGQGFFLRFLPTLNKTYKQWKHFQLQIPYRWPSHDPLEEATNEAFCLSSTPTLPTSLSPTLSSKISYQAINQSELMSNNPLLEQVYHLLVAAHYQTRPTDLERLLSDSGVRVFAAFSETKVIGVVVINQEGELSQKQCEQIESNGTRIKGHLLPQALMAFQGIPMAGKYSFWRVMRIAVDANWRRNSIATELIRRVEQSAKDSKVDYVGTSFSLALDVVNLWYKLGYSCSRIALHLDSSSGNYPAEFIKALLPTKEETVVLLKQSFNQFEKSFVFRLATGYRSINTDILILMLEKQVRKYLEETDDKPNIQELMWANNEIERYLSNARSYEMLDWVIHQCILRQVQKQSNWKLLTTVEKTQLFDKVLKNQSWGDFSETYALTGKKSSQGIIKQIVRKLIEAE